MSETRQLQRHTWFTRYRTSNVAENVGSTFLVRGDIDQEKDFELILAAKMEARVSGTCNHCGVMAAI